MPQYIFSNFSSAEKIKCCKELMQSLFDEKQKVYLSELAYFLKTEEIEFKSGIENQQSQSGFFSDTSSSSIEMQPILRESSHETSSHETSSHETSSEDVLGINEYSRGLLNQLIVKLEEQQESRISYAEQTIQQLKGCHTIASLRKPIEQLCQQVEKVLKTEELEENCTEANKALEATKALLEAQITPQKIAAYREFASTIKSNRSSKSLENIAKTMLVIAGIALAMTLLVAFNVIAASGLLVIAGLTTAFFTRSIGSVLLIVSEPQGLGKAVNDIADNAESIHMLLGNRL